MIDDLTLGAFVSAATSGDDADLPVAALLIARIEHHGLDPAPWLAKLERLGALASASLQRLGPDAPPRRQVEVLNALLFEQEGFSGNERSYDDPRNSFVNDVLDRRTGIPVSLSVIYLDVARRAGVRLEGVNFPGHFLVRYRAGRRHADEPGELLIDPFGGGALLTETDCRQLLRKHAGDEATFDRRMLVTAGKQDILVRMLGNLKRLYVSMRSFPQARDAVNLLVALDPLAAEELRDRGLLSYHMGEHVQALRDLQAYLRITSRAGQAPEQVDEEGRAELQQVWEHVKTLRRRIASFN
jgi:regulator of sirC expression with transglutaminase-like and TPR domain